MLNWLLVFVPIAIGVHYLAPDQHLLTFATAAIAIIPLAGWLGSATEHLAEKTGEAVGGLLNATFGNAAEMIIALVALNKGLYSVVKASLTGSIIGNVLLVLGASMFAGGLKFKSQNFNAVGARSQSTMLLLSAVALTMPAAFHYLSHPANTLIEHGLSFDISIVLLLTYAAGLIFSLHTHKHVFSTQRSEGTPGEPETHESQSTARSLAILAGSTALIAYLSEMLVGSVEQAAHQVGMSSIFVGVIVVAIVGNAAEHSTALLVAMKNRMDLALSIAIGSSIQIALFVAPVLVFASYAVGPKPMDLVFTPAEVLAVVLAVVVTSQAAGDGESNWLEGIQLLAVYAILAIVFYFLPEPVEATH